MAKALANREEPALHGKQVALRGVVPRTRTQRLVVRYIVRSTDLATVKKRNAIISGAYIVSALCYCIGFLVNGPFPEPIPFLWLLYVGAYLVVTFAGRNFERSIPDLLMEQSARQGEALRAVPFRVVSCQLGKYGQKVELGTTRGNDDLHVFMINRDNRVWLEIAAPWDTEDEATETVEIPVRNITLSPLPVLSAAEAVFTTAYYGHGRGETDARWHLGNEVTLYLAGLPSAAELPATK